MTRNEGSELEPHGRHDRVKHHARTQFDKWAESYDRSLLNELVFFPTIRACQEEIIRWRERRSRESYGLLDVGCGTGSLLATLAHDPHAAELVGLDYSPEMVRRAETKLARRPHAARLRVVPGDAEHLPFRDAAFDVITCCHSFHHYPHQAAVIGEFHRVLRPKGVLILIDGFRDNVIGWVVFDVAAATFERHVHHAAWSEIRRTVADAGFADLKQRKLNVLAPLLVNVATRGATERTSR
jgi:ubiquinone/menaquinone biosynthesis C-methylase UbiE